MASSDPRLAPDDRFPLTWSQIEWLAKAKDWKGLSPEIRLKLDEDARRSQQTGIPIDFTDLGFRILRISSGLDPTGSWESRLEALQALAARLLGDRHPALDYVNQCSEQMQALIAINTSPAWAELGSVFRKELERPDWALEAADIALEKNSNNIAALTVKVAAHGELGNFTLAHEDYERASSLSPTKGYLDAAISKVQLREGRFDDALQDGMSAFAAKPHSATARLVGKIYKEAGLDAKARHWFERADYIEGPEKEEITQAHIAGLLELAHSVLSKGNFNRGGTDGKT